MIVMRDEEYVVGEAIASGAKCGLTDGYLVNRTDTHVLVAYAAGDLLPGDTAQVDRNMVARLIAQAPRPGMPSTVITVGQSGDKLDKTILDALARKQRS